MIIAIKSPVYHRRMFVDLAVRGLEKYGYKSFLRHNVWIKAEQFELFDNRYRHNVQLIETYLFFEVTEDDPDFWADFDIDWSLSKIVDVGFDYGVELEVWSVDTTVNTEYFDLVKIDLNIKLNLTVRFENLSGSAYKELLNLIWDNDLILLDDVKSEEIEDTQNKVVINDDDIRGGVFNEESIGLDRDSLMLLINKYGIFNENESYKTVDRMLNGEVYNPVIARALADKYYVKELQFMAREMCRFEKFNENLLALIESAIELNEDCY